MAGGAVKMWVVTSAKSRHPQMGGEVVPVNEAFSNGGMYPGDPVLGPDETANCQCLMDVYGGAPACPARNRSGVGSRLTEEQYRQLEKGAVKNFDRIQADTGLTSSWNGIFRVGDDAVKHIGKADARSIYAIKDWDCSICVGDLYAADVSSGYLTTSKAEHIIAHELAHSFSIMKNRDYSSFMWNPWWEEGVVEGYVSALTRTKAIVYDEWVSAIRAAYTEVKSLPRFDSELSFWRTLIQMPLKDRKNAVNGWLKEAGAGKRLILTDEGPRWEVVKSVAKAAPSALLQRMAGAHTPRQVERALEEVRAYLDTDPEDALRVRLDAESLVIRRNIPA